MQQYLTCTSRNMIWSKRSQANMRKYTSRGAYGRIWVFWAISLSFTTLQVPHPWVPPSKSPLSWIALNVQVIDKILTSALPSVWAPHEKLTGLEIFQSIAPKFCKGILKQTVSATTASIPWFPTFSTAIRTCTLQPLLESCSGILSYWVWSDFAKGNAWIM